MAYADRFDPARFEHDEPVEIHAYRGQRRASVYREHVVPEGVFARILNLAVAYDLDQLGSLDVYGPFELDKSQAQRLAEECGFLRTVVADRLVEPHLAGVEAVADFCWRASEHAWMHIVGP